MPVIPDPDLPERRTLTDADGVPLARFTHVERHGRTVADRFELQVPVQRALPVIAAELRGMRVAGSEELGRGLVAAGGVRARHAHVYSHDLRERPPEPPGLLALDHSAADLLPAYLAAHPPDHVDAATIAGEDSRAFLAGLLRGELGAVLDCSGVAERDGRVVGAIVCARLDAPFGGPWVMELFRAPGANGVGRALLQRALARCPGPALGLAVTEGNSAKELYEALGFERVFTTYSVDL